MSSEEDGVRDEFTRLRGQFVKTEPSLILFRDTITDEPEATGKTGGALSIDFLRLNDRPGIVKQMVWSFSIQPFAPANFINLTDDVRIRIGIGAIVPFKGIVADLGKAGDMLFQTGQHAHGIIANIGPDAGLVEDLQSISDMGSKLRVLGLEVDLGAPMPPGQRAEYNEIDIIGPVGKFDQGPCILRKALHIAFVCHTVCPVFDLLFLQEFYTLHNSVKGARVRGRIVVLFHTVDGKEELVDTRIDDGFNATQISPLAM
jgi:hypothetical protein